MVTKKSAQRKPFVAAHPAKSISKTSASATKSAAKGGDTKKWLLYGSLGVAAVAAIFGGSKLPFFSKVAAPYVAKVASKGLAAAGAAFA